jgi:hypothetical protein
MRGNININLSLGDRNMVAMFPISTGPYMRENVLVIVDDLCGNMIVEQKDPESGATIATHGTFKRDWRNADMSHHKAEAFALVTKLLMEQGTRDCNAVSGNGRWSCE